MERSSVDNSVCQCTEEFRSACYGAADYEHEGQRYCVLHLPTEDKKDDFKKARDDKLGNQDFNFAGSFFPSGTAQFEDHEFVRANFSGATFTGETNFSGAQFGGEWTYFNRAQFSGEGTYFNEAQFSSAETLFFGTQFSSAETSFIEAQFSSERTSFNEAQFSGSKTDFSQATFKEKVAFLGKENTVFIARSLLEFEDCRIDKPELLIFNTVILRPNCFINTDMRKVAFTDVEWVGLPGQFESFYKYLIEVLTGRVRRVKDAIGVFKDHGLVQAWRKLKATSLEDEIEVLKDRDVASPYTLLAQACQRLAANAEENRNYAHASGFNYWAMDTKRKEKWGSAFAPWRLLWWYWALSGYGERTWRSAIWLVGILVGFAVLYVLPFVGSKVQVQELSFLAVWQAFPEAVVYSLGVMSRQAERLVDTAPTLLRALVFIEGILGPLQVALFALAMRRRFMRGKG